MGKGQVLYVPYTMTSEGWKASQLAKPSQAAGFNTN